jgi:hypothetical protein
MLYSTASQLMELGNKSFISHFAGGYRSIAASAIFLREKMSEIVLCAIAMGGRELRLDFL